MKKGITGILMFFAALMGFAQNDTAYIHTYGGERDDQGRDIIQTREGGFALLGATSSFGNGNSDFYLVKVDSGLQFEWSKAIGEFHLEFGHALQQTADGGFILVGYTNSKGAGAYDGYVVRTDSLGNVLWDKTLGGPQWDKFFDVEITAEGGYMIAGETFSSGNGDADAWIVKLDSAGTTIWEKTYGGKAKDLANALIKTRDGSYAFCGENGSINSGQKGDAWLVKIDTAGSVIFESTYDRYQLHEAFHSLMETRSGDFVCVGQIQHFDEKQGINELMIKFNNRGARINDNHNLLGDFTDVMTDVVEQNSGDYITIGYSNTNGNGGGGESFGVRTFSMKDNIAIRSDHTLGDGLYDQKAYGLIRMSENRRIAISTYRSPTNIYTDMGIVEYRSDTVSPYTEKGPITYLDKGTGQVLTLNENNQTQTLAVKNLTDGVYEFAVDENESILSLRILDPSGRIIKEISPKRTESSITLDLSSIQRGVLIIAVEHSQQYSVVKIIN